ncbi:MAG: glycosyltransferase [Planctomycetia bacterium]|nr:glycosyltransferase [Planctomycetia bacterium]
MNCLLLTLGTHGDGELFRLLGRALSRSGHRVTLAASPFYRDRMEATGLDFLPIGNGTQYELGMLFRSLASEPDFRVRVRAYAERWVRPQLAHSLDALKAQLARTDYFINNLRSVWRSEGRIIPGASVTYDPVGDIAAIRKYAAQLAGYESAILELVALPKELVDPDDAWGDRFHFTGFWRDDEPPAWQPPQALIDFIASGPPPVAITMGSMLSFDPAAFVATLRDGLNATGQRGILIGGWSKATAELPENELMFAHAIPYDWLFPRCSLVIHHGGAGTVAAALRAGRPSILLPQIASQEYFAQLLARQGLLAGRMNVMTWRPEELAHTLRHAREDVALTRKAQRWSQRLGGEDSLGRAVALIESHVSIS